MQFVEFCGDLAIMHRKGKCVSAMRKDAATIRYLPMFAFVPAIAPMGKWVGRHNLIEE